MWVGVLTVQTVTVKQRRMNVGHGLIKVYEVATFVRSDSMTPNAHQLAFSHFFHNGLNAVSAFTHFGKVVHLGVPFAMVKLE